MTQGVQTSNFNFNQRPGREECSNFGQMNLGDHSSREIRDLSQERENELIRQLQARIRDLEGIEHHVALLELHKPAADPELQQRISSLEEDNRMLMEHNTALGQRFYNGQETIDNLNKKITTQSQQLVTAQQKSYARKGKIILQDIRLDAAKERLERAEKQLEQMEQKNKQLEKEVKRLKKKRNRSDEGSSSQAQPESSRSKEVQPPAKRRRRANEWRPSEDEILKKQANGRTRIATWELEIVAHKTGRSVAACRSRLNNF